MNIIANRSNLSSIDRISVILDPVADSFSMVAIVEAAQKHTFQGYAIVGRSLDIARE